MSTISSHGSGDYHHRRMEALRDHLEEVGEGEIKEVEDGEEVGKAEAFGAVASAKRHEEKRMDLCRWWLLSSMVARESGLGSDKKERSLAQAPTRKHEHGKCLQGRRRIREAAKRVEDLVLDGSHCSPRIW